MEGLNPNPPKSNESELETQLKYFSFHKKAPSIIAVIVMCLTFIWGIVDPCVFNGGGYWSDEWYGIMELSSGFLCWFIWMLIGAVVSIVTYLLLKFAFAHKLLQIYYLQKNAGEEKKF